MPDQSEDQDDVQETATEEPTFAAPPAPRTVKVNKSCTCG